MSTRYYIRRDRPNGSGLLVTLYWDGRKFSAISAKGYEKSKAAGATAGVLCKRSLAFANELTICSITT